jgi:hypothetical protein
MNQAQKERMEAAKLPEGSAIGVLLEQHARIRDLFAEVDHAQGEKKQQPFDELRELLAVHETGEEMVLRPVSTQTAGKEIAEARNHEEDEAAHVLAELEKLDVASAQFAEKFAHFEQAVSDHADHEETEEFPTVLAARSEQDLQRMGRMLMAAQKLAPTHPHPGVAGSTAAQYAVGPFASLLDRARDAFKRSSSSG